MRSSVRKRVRKICEEKSNQIHKQTTHIECLKRQFGVFFWCVMMIVNAIYISIEFGRIMNNQTDASTCYLNHEKCVRERYVNISRDKFEEFYWYELLEKTQSSHIKCTFILYIFVFNLFCIYFKYFFKEIVTCFSNLKKFHSLIQKS